MNTTSDAIAANTIKLNEKEKQVMGSCFASSQSNGHDFGISTDVKVDGLDRFQVAGYLSKLQTKGLIVLAEPVKVNGVKVRQFEVTEDGHKLFVRPAKTTPGRKTGRKV